MEAEQELESKGAGMEAGMALRAAREAQDEEGRQGERQGLFRGIRWQKSAFAKWTCGFIGIYILSYYGCSQFPGLGREPEVEGCLQAHPRQRCGEGDWKEPDGLGGGVQEVGAQPPRKSSRKAEGVEQREEEHQQGREAGDCHQGEGRQLCEMEGGISRNAESRRKALRGGSQGLERRAQACGGRPGDQLHGCGQRRRADCQECGRGPFASQGSDGPDGDLLRGDGKAKSTDGARNESSSSKLGCGDSYIPKARYGESILATIDPTTRAEARINSSKGGAIAITGYEEAYDRDGVGGARVKDIPAGIACKSPGRAPPTYLGHCRVRTGGILNKRSHRDLGSAGDDTGQRADAWQYSGLDGLSQCSANDDEQKFDVAFWREGKQQEGEQEGGSCLDDPCRGCSGQDGLGGSIAGGVGRQAMSTAEVSFFKKGSNSVRDDTATHTIAGCATFQGSSINCTLVADDPEPTLCGDGELIYQSASWFQSGCAHLKKIRVGTATILWFVAGETTFPSESFHDFLRLLVIYVLGAMIVMVCVYEIDEMWQVSRCLWKHLHGRRIRPIPPCAIFTRALLCQAWGVVCNYMILEFEVQAPMEPNVMESSFGFDVLICLCRYQEFLLLLLGLFSVWSGRLDEMLKLPGKAARADRRIPHRKRRLSNRNFVAVLLLCNILSCEGVGLVSRICERDRVALTMGNDETKTQYPFRPYEDFAPVGDPSRFEGCGNTFAENGSEGSSGQGEVSFFQVSDQVCHAPGDCRANSMLIDICPFGAVQSFEPIFGETKETSCLAPVSGDFRCGGNTATPDFYDDSLGATFLPEEIDDHIVLMQRLSADLQRNHFAMACERGMPLRPALELSRRLLTPVWMQEGRDLAFEYFRSSEQGIWQKKILGWKFLDYEQEIGTPFSIQLLPRGLWATQLIGPFEDEDVLTVHFVVVTPQPMMMHHADHHRGPHDVVVIALEQEAYASDRLPLVVQHDIDGILVQTAVKCPIACTPILVCELLQLDARCQDPSEVSVYFRNGNVERTFVQDERIGLPMGAYVQLSTTIRSDRCADVVIFQHPLREHQTMILPGDAPQDDDFRGQTHEGISLARGTSGRREEEEEETSVLMQVGPPEPDLVVRYIESLGAHVQAVEIAAWFHPQDYVGRTANLVRRAHFYAGLPGGPFVRGMWAQALDNGLGYVYPVRPMPETAGTMAPHFIVANFEGENLIPTLVRFFDDGGGMNTFTFVFTVREWPTMLEVFDLVVPGHGCVWDSDCALVMGPYEHERVYTWNMRVGLYEGAYLRLHEAARQIPAYVLNSDGGSTCDGSSTISDVASDTESDEATAQSTVSSPNAPDEGDDDDSSVMFESLRSSISLMQYEWEFEMAQDEADFLEGVRALPGAPLGAGRYPEMLHLQTQLRYETDIVQSYLRRYALVHEMSTFTVHVWLVEYEIAAFARVVPIAATRSMTESMQRELQQGGGSDSFWITAADPMPLPLSLRICPLDLVVLSTRQKTAEQRIYVIDILFRSMPRRVAMIYQQDERLQDLVRRAGLQEACMPTRHRCILAKTLASGVKVWQLQEIVDELHGTSFELRFEASRESVFCMLEETAMMQVSSTSAIQDHSAERPSFHLSNDRDNTATLYDPFLRPLQEDRRASDSVSFFHSAIHKRSGRLEESSRDDDRADLRHTVRRHVRRRHDMLRVGRLTTFEGFSYMADEAIAYKGSRGRWPNVVICGLVHDVIGYWELTLDDEFSFSLEELRFKLRDFIEPPIRPRESISFAAVKPLPTTLEQQGEDDLYVLVGANLLPSDRLVLIALWDFRQEAVVDLHPMILGATMLRDTLLQQLGLAERCGLAFIDCLVTYETHELPRMMPWRPIQGMKIVVEVHLRRCNSFATWLGIFAGEGGREESDDDVHMLMQTPKAAAGRSSSIAGLGRLTFLEHRVRLQYDRIYELLALRQDPNGLTPVEGSLTSFWLLPGLEKTAQMMDKKLLLHVVVPDWNQWVENSWEQKPDEPQLYLIRQHVPSAGREGVISHVIGTSQNDRSNGLQTVLVDLTYSNIRRRGVLRYHLLATVAELVVLFVGGPIRIHHGIVEDFELHWHDGTTVHIFRGMEIVAIPNAVFVYIVPRGKPLPQICPEEQFSLDSEGELILMQMVSQLELFRPMGNPEDPLPMDETDEISCMQRNAQTSGEMAGDTDLPESLQSAVSFTADPSHALSSDGELPATIPRPGTTLLDAIGRAKHFLADYERVLPPDRDELLVQLLIESYGSTRVCAAYCPRNFLQESVPYWRFQQWCCDNAFLLEESSAVCPVQLELYQNMPALIVARFLARGLVPMVVQVVSPNPMTPAFFLVFLANARETAARLIGRVQAQIQLPPFELRHNGRRVRWFDVLEMVPGGVMRLRIFDTLELQDPSLSTEASGPTVTLQSHNAWSSLQTQGEQTLEQHTLPLGPDLRPLRVEEDARETDDGDENDPFSLIQTVIRARLFDSSRKASLVTKKPCPVRVWHRESCDGLRPPGNPTCWANLHMDRMDDYFHWEGVDVVVDFPFLSLASLEQPREVPFKLALSDYVGDPFSGCDVIQRDITGSQTHEYVQEHHSEPHDQHFSDETAAPVDVAPSISFPDYGPLFHAIYADLPREGHMGFDRGQLKDFLEDETWRELCALPYYWSTSVEKLEIYTDGSMGVDEGSLPSWAFIVFGFREGRRFVLTLDYGVCPTDPMEPGWYGAVQATARNGEIGAQIRVLEWLLAYAFDGETCILYDALSVGEAAAGRSKTQLDDRPMKVLRSLSLAYTTWLDSPSVLTWQHVKSHAGNFGNECVDGLAKLAYRMQTDLVVCNRPEYGPYIFGAKMAMEHFWLSYLPSKTKHDMPQWANDGLCVRHPLPVSTEEKIPSCLVDTLQPRCVTKEKGVRLRVVTYNVSTLGAKTSQMKVQYMREQLEAHGCDIAMLQETRTRSSQMVQSNSHIRITSAAKEGKGGTEIWLLRYHPRSGHILFDPKTVQVYFADPEILLLRAHFQGTPLLLCSAHAPHTGWHTEDIAAFWKRLTDLVCQYGRSEVHFIGGLDANAHFTFECPPYVGSWGLEQRGNEAAEHFLQFLKETALFAPSTYEELHDGETTTWRSPANGTSSRCDYLLLPLTWKAGSLQTFAMPTLDSGTSGEDHVPLGGDFWVFVQTCFRKGKNKSFDRQKIQKDTGGKLSLIFETPPCIDWSVDVDVHAAQLTKWVQDQLVENYPATGVRRKKSYISDSTWALRMERIGCRKEQTDRKHWMAVHTLKWAWKGLRSDRQEYGMSRGFWAPFFRFLADRKKCARLSTRGYKGVVFEFWS